MVNGKPIMRADVETVYRSNLGDSKQEPPKDQADNVRLNIVREQIDEEIVDQRAAKLNLTASDDEVETKLAEFKAPYTQEEFDQKLKSQHLTLDELKKEIRKNRTQEKLFNKEINSKINITDANITNYYNAHKADFNLVEPRYHLAQIVVTPQPAQQGQQQPINMQNSKAGSDADAKKKIDVLHGRLESGEDFSTLAANFSEDPNTSTNGGDMGGIQESVLRRQPEVFQVIDKLKAGQMTPVMTIPDAPGSKRAAYYVIFKLIDREAAGQRELNDPRVQQTIRAELRQERSQLLKNAYIEMLRDQAHVENYFAEEIFKNGAQ
ncbi:Survival protein SurA precursor (Peptidyl-prolyl cis-trans isomerase SurA) [Acidisarcina polymorpha]|uniref:Survival protein SurA (Peptidyl-prolyl cis-trans isomerase SurA) n=2 Tax=Acidisarcina polymorpha TaxID=2211140 RepID=A0A2Z5FXW0_9BACT|nr:Survival protein SurA precursor (Peptidyl-prolyl cis-trans isomerase SurA) [Acidisarcina polymorpha]